MAEKKQLKELSDDELESVNGGCGESWEEKTSKYLPANHGAHIGESDAINHVGKKCYFVKDEHPDTYCVATLEKVYEKSVWMGDCTRKMYQVYVYKATGHWSDYIVGTHNDIEADDHTVYLFN